MRSHELDGAVSVFAGELLIQILRLNKKIFDYNLSVPGLRLQSRVGLKNMLIGYEQKYLSGWKQHVRSIV